MLDWFHEHWKMLGGIALFGALAWLLSKRIAANAAAQEQTAQTGQDVLDASALNAAWQVAQVQQLQQQAAFNAAGITGAQADVSYNASTAASDLASKILAGANLAATLGTDVAPGDYAAPVPAPSSSPTPTPTTDPVSTTASIDTFSIGRPVGGTGAQDAAALGAARTRDAISEPVTVTTVVTTAPVVTTEPVSTPNTSPVYDFSIGRRR